MKAMILAAGVGSRLRPLTDSIPKALIEVNGVALLETVVLRLKAAGVDSVIINLHHFPDQIRGFLKDRKNFGLRIEFSFEPELLDTGGGLKQAAWFFDDGKPFILHNADVLSDIDIAALVRTHERSGALAMLAVEDRPSARRLLFSTEGYLCGWETPAEFRRVEAHQAAETPERLAFNGIHAISPRLLGMITETGTFSIIHSYIRLAGESERIAAFRTDGVYCRDIGTLAKLNAARRNNS